jgi:hypothetical protein
MAFDSTTMVLMAHGNNFKQYHYETADALRAVEADGYFDAFDEQLRSGDLIWVRASDGSRLYEATVAADDVSLAAYSHGSAKVTTASTTANIANHGLTQLAATSTQTKAYVLDDPVAGIEKRLVATGGSTNQTVTVQSTATTLLSTGGNTIGFTMPSQAVTLVGRSTSAWALAAIVESSTGVLPTIS